MSIHRHYYPRYTPGSPGDVDLNHIDICAAERHEREFYEGALEGIYGEGARQEAREKGLKGILVETIFKGNKKFCRDMITNEKWTEDQSERMPGVTRVSLKVLEAVRAARIVGDNVLQCLGRNDATFRALGRARLALIERYGEAEIEAAEEALIKENES